MKDRKEYAKAWREAHKEEVKAYNKVANKAYYQAHKEQQKEYMKAYSQAHKEQQKEYMKAYNQAHKEEHNAYMKVYMKAYQKADVNALGQTKNSIRVKSSHILKQMNLHIDDYEIHHCFGYEDPAKFIYISKSLHLKIHKYLREHNIDASRDHWMHIRDLVNDTDEFTYIKC